MKISQLVRVLQEIMSRLGDRDVGLHIKGDVTIGCQNGDHVYRVDDRVDISAIEENGDGDVYLRNQRRI